MEFGLMLASPFDLAVSALTKPLKNGTSDSLSECIGKVGAIGSAILFSSGVVIAQFPIHAKLGVSVLPVSFSLMLLFGLILVVGVSWTDFRQNK